MNDPKGLLDKIAYFLNSLEFDDKQSIDSLNCEWTTDRSVKVDKIVFDGLKVKMESGVLTVSQKSHNSQRFELEQRKTEALEKIVDLLELKSWTHALDSDKESVKLFIEGSLEAINKKNK